MNIIKMNVKWTISKKTQKKPQSKFSVIVLELSQI